MRHVGDTAVSVADNKQRTNDGKTIMLQVFNVKQHIFKNKKKRKKSKQANNNKQNI